MSQVFISYSRKDKMFVERLQEALAGQKRDTWVDWNNIPPTAKWLKEIFDGIEAADNFIFVISPDSISSQVCDKEISHAAAHNKRFIPLIYRDVGSTNLPEPIASHNWIDFRANSEFQKSIDSLIKAIDTDMDYIRSHTQLLLKAQEWATYQRDRSYLLSGSELRLAEQWLLTAAKKQPQPTKFQSEFIEASLEAEHESVQQRKIRQRYLTIRDDALKVYVRSYLNQRMENLEERRKTFAKSDFIKFSAAVLELEEELSALQNFLDLGGKWHPEEPIHVKTLGAQEDYLEVFEFPCCDKSVIADRPPSRFRPDGCQESPILAEDFHD